MKQKNIHIPEKTVYKTTLTAGGTVTPDLNGHEVFRITATGYSLVVANPTNIKDGQYMRIEVVSANAKTVNFGTGYHLNGAVIADATHDADELVIYEGLYNADTSKVNLVAVGIKAV